MALLETTLISALAPAAIDALKSLFGGISRKIGGLSVDEEIKLSTANTERLKALAELDNPYGTPSQWVVDVRASFRYIAAGICVLAGLGSLYFAPVLAELGVQIAAAAFSFIFGERMLMNIKGK